MKTTGERSQVLTDVAVTETTEVWGREAVSYVSCSNNHEKADGLMADGVLEKSLSYVHTHEPPPQSVPAMALSITRRLGQGTS